MMRTTSRKLVKAKRLTSPRIRRNPVSPLKRRLYSSTSKARIASAKKPTKMSNKKIMMALLIAAHNEELVLAKTISSAINAGMKAENIYVVDDNSIDITSKIAKTLVPATNVVKVRRSGKGLALTKAAKKFRLTSKYRWIHIADADGAFAPDYFRIFRREVRVENAAATGYIRSLPGQRVSEFRIMEYTVGMEVHRRFQNIFNVIPVIPGPTSCFRADVFDKVNFNNGSLTEDFDVTIQLHRQDLGKIQFIPEAITYTQDPKTIRDFIKQITRWNRGGLQSMRKHKIGQKASALDAYLTYQIVQNFLFVASYFIWIPYLAVTRHTLAVVATAFIVDVLITYFITFMTAIKTKRWDVLSGFPFIYVLRWVSLAVFLKAFVEIIVLRKFKSSAGAWENSASRRYVIETA